MKQWTRFFPILEIVLSNQFRKDLKQAKKRGLKIEKPSEVVNTIANQNFFGRKIS